MASIQKTASGWRVQIQRRGVRLSRTFATKAAASAWALQQERGIIDGDVHRWPRQTVAQVLDRYEREVTSRKRSAAAETKRLLAFQRHYPALANMQFAEVTAREVSAYRDDRLSKVTPGSVQRDINLLRHVWSHAIREWRAAGENPWSRIQMPGQNPPRDRLIGWREIRRVLRRCGYSTGVTPRTGVQLVGWAFLISLRTALRAGEVLSLTGETVNLERRVVTLATHKTVEKVGRRLVPLTPQAARLLAVLWRQGQLVPINPRTLDALWRKLRDQVLLEDLHFHDARATALTHLARKVDVLTLARISGHKDLNLLLAAYYRETAEQISARLAVPKR